MKTRFLTSVAVGVLLSFSAHAEERQFTATLESHAILPANTIIAAPADAPVHLKTSGKFTTPDRRRTDAVGSVPGKDGVRPTGLSLPFDGQAVQGFSGIKTMSDGTFWSLSDNGLGNKMNSSDSALMLHNIKLDWTAGKVERLKTVFLSDPDRKAPFPIVLEGSETRYLTGADFDVESIQPVEDGFWLGEEFGPYLIKVDKTGKLLEVFETVVDGQPVRSPDHPALTLPGNPTQKMPAFNIKRSGGYEGLALSKDGSRLYGLLEGPRYMEDGSVEKADDGSTVLRIIEFDVAGKKWTGRNWLYPLAEGGEAIGDFNMIDETTALVIERDNGVGVASKACADPKSPQVDCFDKPSKVKRVYKIEMTDANAGGAVRKIGYIDLLDIKDPNNKKLQGGGEGYYDMPFLTIEDVDVIDETHIVVGNDNNLPFSAGRFLDRADDNEFVLLEVGEFLKAK
ncbi:MAG: esterase-like activity of phytase family protein [Phyllobacterium sp.]